MNTPNLITLISAGIAAFAVAFAALIGWRSSRDNILFKERQSRISEKADEAKSTAIATEATVMAQYKGFELMIGSMETRLQRTEDRASKAEAEADKYSAHAAECDKRLAFFEAVAKIKGWPDPDCPQEG